MHIRGAAQQADVTEDGETDLLSAEPLLVGLLLLAQRREPLLVLRVLLLPVRCLLRQLSTHTHPRQHSQSVWRSKENTVSESCPQNTLKTTHWLV